jgi:hypothetical protein
MQLTEAENVGQSHIKQFLMKPGVLSKIDLLTNIIGLPFIVVKVWT